MCLVVLWLSNETLTNGINVAHLMVNRKNKSESLGGQAVIMIMKHAILMNTYGKLWLAALTAAARQRRGED